GADRVPTAREAAEFGFIPFGISTQSLCLDLSIGRPGLPAGRLTQILGLDGHGKSSLATSIMAETQRIGGHAVLVDTEGSYEAWRLRKLGVRVRSPMHHDDCDCKEFCAGAYEPLWPQTLEELFGMCQTYITQFRKDNPDTPLTVVVDSLDGLPPEARAEADHDESLPMVNARVIGERLPKLITAVARYKPVLIFVSQLTTKANSGFRGRWSGPEYDTK